MSNDTAPAAVSEQDRVQAAWNELNLVLSFFPRVDTRLSAVLAINLGLIGWAVGRWPSSDKLTLTAVSIALAFLFTLANRFRHAANAILPNTNGGTGSLVFYGSIAGMAESDFRDQFMARSSHQLACDLLEQAWRNSKVLECKFKALCGAVLWMIWTIPSWVLLLLVLPEGTAS